MPSAILRVALTSYEGHPPFAKLIALSGLLGKPETRRFDRTTSERPGSLPAGVAFLLTRGSAIDECR